MDLFAQLTTLKGLSPEAYERANAPVTRALAQEVEKAAAAALAADLLGGAGAGVTTNRIHEIALGALVKWVRYGTEPLTELRRDGARPREVRVALAVMADDVDRSAFALRRSAALGAPSPIATPASTRRPRPAARPSQRAKAR